MPTNKLVLKSVDEFMADYKPTYNPLYPLLLGNAQQYSQEVGLLNFKRLEAVGDIRTKHITPKDTDMKQIAVTEKSKTFKKYFMGNQFVQSLLQDASRNEDVVRQVLDEHQKQMDILMIEGEGSADNNVVNNGLFWSGDENHTTNSSHEVDTDADPLIGLHAKVIEQAQIANQIEGQKAVIFYGSNVLPYVGGLFAASNNPFKRVLSESLGAGWSLVEMPTAVTPSSAHGFLIVNLSQTKLHYTTLPQLAAQGVNDEKMYSWHNFIMGSCMVDVLVPNGVIKQPITFEA